MYWLDPDRGYGSINSNLGPEGPLISTPTSEGPSISIPTSDMNHAISLITHLDSSPQALDHLDSSQAPDVEGVSLAPPHPAAAAEMLAIGFLLWWAQPPPCGQDNCTRSNLMSPQVNLHLLLSQQSNSRNTGSFSQLDALNEDLNGDSAKGRRITSLSDKQTLHLILSLFKCPKSTDSDGQKDDSMDRRSPDHRSLDLFLEKSVDILQQSVSNLNAKSSASAQKDAKATCHMEESLEAVTSSLQAVSLCLVQASSSGHQLTLPPLLCSLLMKLWTSSDDPIVLGLIAESIGLIFHTFGLSPPSSSLAPSEIGLNFDRIKWMDLIFKAMVGRKGESSNASLNQSSREQKGSQMTIDYISSVLWYPFGWAVGSRSPPKAQENPFASLSPGTNALKHPSQLIFESNEQMALALSRLSSPLPPSRSHTSFTGHVKMQEDKRTLHHWLSLLLIELADYKRQLATTTPSSATTTPSSATTTPSSAPSSLSSPVTLMDSSQLAGHTTAPLATPKAKTPSKFLSEYAKSLVESVREAHSWSDSHHPSFTAPPHPLHPPPPPPQYHLGLDGSDPSDPWGSAADVVTRQVSVTCHVTPGPSTSPSHLSCHL